MVRVRAAGCGLVVGVLLALVVLWMVTAGSAGSQMARGGYSVQTATAAWFVGRYPNGTPARNGGR